MCGLKRKPQPTAEMMNRGPELLQNANMRAASVFVQLPERYKSFTQTAPTGYPLTIPRMRGIAPQPGTLNKGLIMGERYLLKTWAKPDFVR